MKTTRMRVVFFALRPPITSLRRGLNSTSFHRQTGVFHVSGRAPA